MLNLTSTTLLLTPADGRDPTTLRRAGPVAADCIHDGLVPHGKRIDPGSGPMNTATLAAASPAQIENLNRLVEEHIRKDETDTGREGLVLIDRRLLPYIEPRLRDRVAAPRLDHRGLAIDDTARVCMLILPYAELVEYGERAAKIALGWKPPVHWRHRRVQLPTVGP
jgi:hypothetical protein